MTVIQECIQRLEGELRRIEAVLKILRTEEPPVNGDMPRRRGRKSMGPEERQQVSERLKRYWAKRRREKAQK